MIVHNLDILSIAIAPDKADSPLVIDADAVLALAITRELFKAIAGRNAQILQRLRVVQHGELASGDSFDALETRKPQAVENRFRVPASERPYHRAWYYVVRKMSKFFQSVAMLRRRHAPLMAASGVFTEA